MFQAKATSDLAALRKEQARLERETGQHLLVGLSLGATVQQLVKCVVHTGAVCTPWALYAVAVRA